MIGGKLSPWPTEDTSSSNGGGAALGVQIFRRKGRTGRIYPQQDSRLLYVLYWGEELSWFVFGHTHIFSLKRLSAFHNGWSLSLIEFFLTVFLLHTFL